MANSTFEAEVSDALSSSARSTPHSISQHSSSLVITEVI